MPPSFPASRLAPFLLGLALLTTGTQARAADAATDPADVDFNDASYPVIITPTRLKQSLADVPASITVITAEMLQRYGITHIPEALRLVPGMHVTHSAGQVYDVNYHGTREVTPRRLNVLIDGVSAYQPALSIMEWSSLPVSMEDIARIEVIRGPDSAAYGPNSMMAVINILTKHPRDVERVMASITGDDHRMATATARVSATSGGTSVRLTADILHDEGFDSLGEGIDFGGMHVEQAPDRQARDGTRVKRLTLRAEQELPDRSTLQIGIGAVQAFVERSMSGLLGSDQSDGMGGALSLAQPLQPPDTRRNSHTVSLRWTKQTSADHELQVQAFQGAIQQHIQMQAIGPEIALWGESRALYDLNPELGLRTSTWLIQQLQGIEADAPATSTPAEAAALAELRQRIDNTPAWWVPNVAGTLDEMDKVARTQLEVQSTHVLSDTLRMVGGAGWRSEYLDSLTFVNGRVSNKVSWLFGHVEYRPRPWLAVNAGGYREHNGLSGNSFAPRLAVNAQMAPGHTLRAVISKGLRTPDIMEERAYWRYHFTGLSRPIDGSTSGALYMLGRSQGGLTSEKIWSREIGYLMQQPHEGFSLDVRVFDERLSKLISGTLSAHTSTLSNAGATHLSGAEAQWQWELSPNWSLWGQYSHLLNWQTEVIDERSQYSRHTGALGISWAMRTNWRVSLAHYGYSGDGVFESGYARTDLTLNHDAAFGIEQAHLSLTLSQLHTPTTVYFTDVGRSATSILDKKLRVLARMKVAF
ncbi:MAG: TonB-dependent receptor [Aquabacterium sp.]